MLPCICFFFIKSDNTQFKKDNNNNKKNNRNRLNTIAYFFFFSATLQHRCKRQCATNDEIHTQKWMNEWEEGKKKDIRLTSKWCINQKHWPKTKFFFFFVKKKQRTGEEVEEEEEEEGDEENAIKLWNNTQVFHFLLNQILNQMKFEYFWICIIISDCTHVFLLVKLIPRLLMIIIHYFFGKNSQTNARFFTSLSHHRVSLTHRCYAIVISQKKKIGIILYWRVWRVSTWNRTCFFNAVCCCFIWNFTNSWLLCFSREK